jgi:hypothetical protein
MRALATEGPDRLGAAAPKHGFERGEVAPAALRAADQPLHITPPDLRRGAEALAAQRARKKKSTRM